MFHKEDYESGKTHQEEQQKEYKIPIGTKNIHPAKNCQRGLKLCGEKNPYISPGKGSISKSMIESL